MNKNKFLIITLIITFLTSFFLIQKMSKKINPIILRYSTIEAKRITKILVNESIKKSITSKDDDNLFTIEKDKNDNIQMIDYNTEKVNKLLIKITDNIQSDLLDLENGKLKDEIKISDNFRGIGYKNIKNGIICGLPTSSIFSNSLLANFGPNIPIKLSFIGSVTANLNTKIKSYGINNVFLEISIHVEVDERITMPMMTKEVKISQDIPLTLKVIQGTIPNYYYQNGLTENSNAYSLPITK